MSPPATTADDGGLIITFPRAWTAAQRRARGVDELDVSVLEWTA